MKHIYFSILLLAPILSWSILAGLDSIKFDLEVDAHLRLAAYAPSVEDAHRELGIALRNLEHRGMTTGYTSVFWNSDDESVELWYGRLRKIHDSISDPYELDIEYTGEIGTGEPEVMAMKAVKLSLVDSSITLLRLRQILVKDGDRSSSISPEGITRFPNNQAMAWLFILGVLAFAPGLFLGIMGFDDVTA